MIKISNEDRAFLIEIMPEAEQLLESDNMNDILIPLNEWIAMHGYTSEGDEAYVLTDLGRKVERIYDRIYYEN